MSHPEKTASGPLERLPEEEIRHLLRGFPDSAIAAAIALRTGSEIENFDDFAPMRKKIYPSLTHQ